MSNLYTTATVIIAKNKKEMTNFGRYNQSKSVNFIVPFHCLEYKLDLKQSSCHEAINHLVRLKRCVTLDLRNNFFSQHRVRRRHCTFFLSYNVNDSIVLITTNQLFDSYTCSMSRSD